MKQTNTFNGKWQIQAVAILLPLFLLIAGFLVYKGMIIPAMLTIFVIGPMLAWAIILAIGWCYPRFIKSLYGNWHGQYYEFEAQHIRVIECDGALWIAAVDAYKALDLRKPKNFQQLYTEAECAPIPDTGLLGFSEAGVEKFIAVQQTQSALEIKRAQKFGLWYTRQVIMPFHRKQQMAQEAGLKYLAEHDTQSAKSNDKIEQ